MGEQDRAWAPRRWRWIAVAAALLAALAAGPARAADKAKSAVLVVDANTGRVLHQSAADEPRHPASLAKMMTIYLVFELIEQGRLGYHTRIKFSANAVAAAPSKLDLAEGDELSLLDAIKLLITKSANDVAIAIAEHIAGSEERFARLMTQKARQLGMTATVFRNASGLPDEAQVTTARDMVTLALRLQDDFPRHYPLFATRTATYKDETYRNHNTLLFHYEGTDGIKTGYTRASGFNLVASVRRGRKHVIGAVFGGASADSRNAAMRTFLNMGLVKASTEVTRKPASPLVAEASPPAAEKRAAQAPKPQRVPRPATAAAPAPPSPPAPGRPPLEPSAAPRSSAPPIEIARVRPITVVPRATNRAADDGSGSQPSPDRREDIAAASPWTASATLAAAAQPAPAAPATADTRGAPPSTLGAQAANLARGEPALAAPGQTGGAPRPPTAAPPAPKRRIDATASTGSGAVGGFQVQIGAFQSQAEAERQLAAVRERAPSVLARGSPVTVQVHQGQKVLYRARYAGFDAPAAAQACAELKRLKVDCLVVRAE
jgi:D-alanyl-D-alanine carboxypeptidase